MQFKLGLVLLLASQLFAEKRPLNHADYDGWKHIQNQQLSSDGHYLAYAVFPQQGDGELILRDLKTGKETRQAVGELPPPPRPNYALPQTEDAPPAPPGISVRFSPDSKTLVFLTFATHEDIEKAKRARKRADEMPRGDLVVIDTASGEVFRAPRVKSFQLPTRANGWVAYLQMPEQPAADGKGRSAPEAASPAAEGSGERAARIETGDLVLRKLEGGAERRFHDASEYTLTNDGQLLVYAAVAAGKPEGGGVYLSTTATAAEPTALLSGQGKYEKLAWDEEQTRLAFVSNRDDASARQATFKLYTWARGESAAAEAVSAKTSGFPAGWAISDRPVLTVAKGGTRIFFGTAPQAAPPKPPDNTPADERVSVDLWAWNDDYIQPMQKVRAAVERGRTYRAVYDLKTKKFLQLADQSMNEVLPSEDGAFAMGEDDREYRRIQEYDERYQDTYVVNTATGERKLAAEKHSGRLVWSPDGKYAIFYDGKDWETISAPDGRLTNLTAKLGVSFGREQYDAPGPAPSYGLAAWTKDGQYALINDRFDVWRVKPDGSVAVRMTNGRPEHLAFRVVRGERGEPEDRWVDQSKPLLLRAENDDTHDSGFYRLAGTGKSGWTFYTPSSSTKAEPSSSPERLAWAAKYFAPAIKARDAEVYVTAASTFQDFPDLLVTTDGFRTFQKVSNVGAQLDGISWGTAELMHFKSVDGTPLQGTLYKPENFDPKKKYPLIVYIYERLSQNVHNFVEPRPTNVISPSYYASNGYLVLEPDIAYKIGYPGQSALNCVLPAVQAVVDQGFVDEKAIGIQGHSWGGYQIAYMVTRTNRFRAAAPGAPVANMISAYDGIRWGPGIPRQFQYEHTQSRIGGTIWDYPLRYIENSPIFMADRVSTPLLMIHNDADDAVPWYQGIEYYLALRRLGKEVYMFSYNGEPHNLRRRPNQKDYTVRLQQFFDYYLKGASKPEWMEHGIPFIEKSGALPTDAQ